MHFSKYTCVCVYISVHVFTYDCCVIYVCKCVLYMYVSK